MNEISYTVGNPGAGESAGRELERQFAAAQVEIANLQLALQSARTIGTALGIIMALQKLTSDAAFQVLVRASQQQNRKLRDVAEEVVQYGAVLRPACPSDASISA